MLRFAGMLVLLPLLTGCGGVYLAHGSNEDRRTPLEKAAQAGDPSDVKQLLTAGADPNDRAGLFGSPLDAAASRQDNVEVIRLLLAAGANPNGRPAEGDRCWSSPLFQAASLGDVKNTRALLEAGASVQPSRCARLVVGWIQPAISDLLVRFGLNLHSVDERGRNLLHLALAPPVVPRLDGIEYLVRAGVPVNARDAQGRTPLSYWREPRDHEVHWFAYWLIDRLSGDSSEAKQRAGRAAISAYLEHSGATL
jgi:ankyrin repeat protein